jgi:hypothetical protein
MGMIQYRLRENAHRFNVSALLAALTSAALPEPVDVFFDVATLAVRLTFNSDLTSAQLTNIAALVETRIVACETSIAEERGRKHDEIDRKTAGLIFAGFTYQGKTFSLSLAAQATLLGAYITRASLSYPIDWSTADNADKITINNSTEVEDFYLAAVGIVRGHLDAGNVIKGQIRAAANKDAVKNISDSR